MKKYRHPKETRAMLFTFGTALLLSLAFATVTLGCGLFILGIALTWGAFKLFSEGDVGSKYIEVTETNQSEIWRAVQQARRKWQMRDLTIYLDPTAQINAAASDFGKDFIIINRGLWQAITDQKQRLFVIGHELGHIGLGHSWLSVIAQQVDNSFQRHWLGLLFQLVLLRYYRMKEFSADRIGLISCGSLDAALETMALLAMGGRIPSRSELHATVQQLKSGHATFNQNMAEMLSTHPDFYERVQELIKFAPRVGL